MCADKIGEIGDRASEGQATGVYGAGFTVGPLTRKGARGGLRGTGNKVISDKELVEVGRMVGREEGCNWRDQIRGCGYVLCGYISKNEDQGGRWGLRDKWVWFWVEWVEGCNESGVGEGGGGSHGRQRQR
jgi:hypothetical protein